MGEFGENASGKHHFSEEVESLGAAGKLQLLVSHALNYAASEAHTMQGRPLLARLSYAEGKTHALKSELSSSKIKLSASK